VKKPDLPPLFKDWCPKRVALQASVFLALTTSPGFAFTPEFPTVSAQTAAIPAALASYRLPTGPWRPEGMALRRIEGQTERIAWKLDAPDLSTLEIMGPLRQQLESEGYAILFECETEGCGGFDFRYAAEILPEPDMHVDLGDFRFLSAQKGKADAVSLMVSRSSLFGFVQMTRVSAAGATPRLPMPQLAQAPGAKAESGTRQITLSTASRPTLVGPPETLTDQLAEQLVIGGAVVLDGLAFATGAAELSEGRYPSLQALADWLRANPDKTLALVGHTDASGSLEANIALSKRRAQSVRTRLIADYAIPEAQIEAQGVGYLSPRNSNLTDEGRQQNRRVEAILTSTR
jgi:outer membrane protein OmpA-like peptidoglycan-associated protein